MKNIILLISALVLSFSSIAQAPEQLNYQGVARDFSGNPLANQTIGLQFSILSGSANGTTAYAEQHTVVTNSLGLFNLIIGNGTIVDGAFSTIDWGNNSNYLKVEMDESGGLTYSDIGTSQLVSVPYAFYAENGGEWEVDGMGINSKNRNIAINTVNTNPQYIIQGNKDESEMRIRMGTGNGITSYGTNFNYTSQVFIGSNEEDAGVGFAFDAMDGDGEGIDYGTLYQYDDGNIELNNRSNNDLIFATNNEDRMIIRDDGNADLFGNLAIGTVNSNPQYLIQGTKGNSELRVRMGTGNGNTSYGTNFSHASQVFIGAGETDAGAGFIFDAINGDGIGSDYGTLYQYDDGKIELNNRGNNDLIFATNNLERMRITNYGDVYMPSSTKGIIMTSPSGSCWKLLVNDSGLPVFTTTPCPN